MYRAKNWDFILALFITPKPGKHQNVYQLVNAQANYSVAILQNTTQKLWYVHRTESIESMEYYTTIKNK